MLQIESLSKAYGGRELFSGVSFSLQKGERCGLLGRNGSGKSTLFRVIAGEESADSGRAQLPKQYRLGTLKQHMDWSQATIRDEAALGLPEGEEESLYRVDKILFGLGFKEGDLRRAPSEFSGGYQLRLHLAKVLINEPDLLLLDEPTNYLDVLAIRWLERFLRSWKGEMLLISHDRQFVDAVCTHTMGIHRGQVLKVRGDSEAYYQQLLEREEMHERTRQNLEKKRSQAEAFIQRFGAKATKAKQAQSRAKMLQRLPTLEKLANLRHMNFRFPPAPFPGRVMLEADSLKFVYDDMRDPPESGWLINDVSLSIENGERLAVIGKNGRGKSTLLKLLVAELKPQEGKLKLSENTQIGYFGQTPIDRLNTEHTIEEEISAACPELSTGEVRSICGLMMFEGDLAKKKIGVLSGGERSRVHLGKLLARPCNLLILDEPTNHLDMESIEAMVHAVDEFPGSVILVTHDEELLRRIPDKLLICRSGEQEFFWGNYEEFLEKKGWGDEDAGEKKNAGNKLSRKDLKRQRAEMVSERSRKLKPLRTQSEKLETQIQKLETREQSLNDELIAASQRDNAQAIQELSKDLAKVKEEIEQAFTTWEELAEAMQAIEREYETLLN